MDVPLPGVSQPASPLDQPAVQDSWGRRSGCPISCCGRALTDPEANLHFEGLQGQADYPPELHTAIQQNFIITDSVMRNSRLIQTFI